MAASKTKRAPDGARMTAPESVANTAADKARRVLVTGGSRGLGLAIAQKLAGAGYHTITLARRESNEVGAAIAQAEKAGQGRYRSCHSIWARSTISPTWCAVCASNSARSTVSSTTPRSGCPERWR
jgi:NAD(P)-dependent dehydrogenase (short-subunit alcohol dehydrogenase family)